MSAPGAAQAGIPRLEVHSSERVGVPVLPTSPNARRTFSVHSARDLAHVENELNRRPRITLGDRAPADLFTTLLASENHPSLR